MTLIVGDMHFGRGSAEAERRKEAALIDCLRAFEGRAERLVLLGDVFDAYIEYRTLVPKGFVRFQGLLAEWTDRGVLVTYLTGNHDLWHRDYFARELGVAVVPVRWVGRLGGRRAVLTHGDADDASDPLYRRLRPLMRSEVVASLYRRLLPGGAALEWAQAFNRTFHEETIDFDRVRALRRAARRMLGRTSAELVVMGHSHRPERRTWSEAGTYLNTGAWHTDRTFATVAADGEARLRRWNGVRAVGINNRV
ncbi:MAG: UDP-2,3-diacylglucosamine diphosphatase [Bacteroidetes bacterium QS_1_65_9]|nr:MAG: UDP-2,3-diacylglucosamine diphosphatase [Bacteroidetes bacterium QS_1_65_9]